MYTTIYYTHTTYDLYGTYIYIYKTQALRVYIYIYVYIYMYVYTHTHTSYPFVSFSGALRSTAPRRPRQRHALRGEAERGLLAWWGATCQSMWWLDRQGEGPSEGQTSAKMVKTWENHRKTRGKWGFQWMSWFHQPQIVKFNGICPKRLGIFHLI